MTELKPNLDFSFLLVKVLTRQRDHRHSAEWLKIADFPLPSPLMGGLFQTTSI